MTGPQGDNRQTRAGDADAELSYRERVLVFWRRWGQLIIGAWLITISLFVLLIALEVRSVQLDKKRQEMLTAKVARQACERSKALGPSLVLDYQRRKVLTGADLTLYRSLIPKTCPSK